MPGNAAHGRWQPHVTPALAQRRAGDYRRISRKPLIIVICDFLQTEIRHQIRHKVLKSDTDEDCESPASIFQCVQEWPEVLLQTANRFGHFVVQPVGVTIRVSSLDPATLVNFASVYKV